MLTITRFTVGCSELRKGTTHFSAECPEYQKRQKDTRLANDFCGFDKIVSFDSG